MDLNELLFHHQIALIRTAYVHAHEPCGSSFDIVAHYERRIVRLRKEMGVPQYPVWSENEESLDCQQKCMAH